MKWGLSIVFLLTGLCALSSCNSHQYVFIDKLLSWSEAQSFCREHFTDLATIDNSEEMERLIQTAKNISAAGTDMAWIGLYEDMKTSWTWSLSSEDFYTEEERDYRNWETDQPDNYGGNQRCVTMREGKWDDRECSEENQFVCYDGKENTTDPFILVEEKRSWPEALAYCRQKHTDLASVRDGEENHKIATLNQAIRLWIGLKRSSEWSDQSVSTYRNWLEGKPDNTGADQSCTACELGNAGRWTDGMCNRTLAFVCYRDESEHYGKFQIQKKQEKFIGGRYDADSDPDVLELVIQFVPTDTFELASIRITLMAMLQELLSSIGLTANFNIEQEFEIIPDSTATDPIEIRINFLPIAATSKRADFLISKIAKLLTAFGFDAVKVPAPPEL